MELIQRDAEMFARAISATRRDDGQAFRRALRAATEVQEEVLASSRTIQAASRAAQRTIKPRFRSDLRCVSVLAVACGQAARTLIQTNRAWLRDRAYSTQVRRRLRTSTRRDRS